MRVLDLFCGAGGLSFGFGKMGMNVTGVDISEQAGRTFRLNNRGQFTNADLSNKMIDGEFHVIIGGPPCKPWSSVNLTKRGKDHTDHCLISRFFAHIEYHMPRIFLLENVPPLANDASFRDHIEELVERGYSISRKIINYSDFGAPTKRRRFIVFGSRKENSDEFFRKLSSQTYRSRTVKDAIWDLRKKRKGEVPDHFWPELRTINKYRDNYENGKFGWYILKWEEPAPSFGNVMKTYILHPDASNGGPTRVISVKEALLIMGFDETFHFPEDIGMGMRYQMVADSVSPVFSLAAAKVIKGMLFDQD